MTKTKNLKLETIQQGDDNWWSKATANNLIIDSLGDGYKSPRFEGDSTTLYALLKDGTKIPVFKAVPQLDGSVSIEIGRAGDTLVLKNETYGIQNIQLPITVWQSGILYQVGQRVRLYGLLFECLVPHRSTAFSRDLVNWVCLSQSAGIVNQAANGFQAFRAIYHNGTSWGYALADAASTLSDPPTIVVAAYGDYFLYSMAGILEIDNSLTPGQVYYLSSTVSGVADATEPTIFSNPIVRAIDATHISILPYRATEVL